MLPHFDVRECPECYSLVFHQAGQDHHLEDHGDLWDLFNEFERRIVECEKRVGITEEGVEIPARWTAVVGGPGELGEGGDE